VTHPILPRLRGHLIVSCQALPGSPLRDSTIIAALAQCAERGGAGGVRIDGPDDIAAVRRVVAIPVIGLYKMRESSPVYITPTFEAARAVAAAGADIVAVQATRERAATPHPLPQLIARIHQDCRVAVMADVSTLDEGTAAEAAGADLVATTMAGYTPHSRQLPGPDLELIRELAAQGKTIFYCSHILDVVERVCLRVIIIDRGKIVADAPVSELKQSTKQGSLEDVFKKLTDSTEVNEIAKSFSAVVAGSQ